MLNKIFIPDTFVLLSEQITGSNVYVDCGTTYAQSNQF